MAALIGPLNTSTPVVIRVIRVIRVIWVSRRWWVVVEVAEVVMAALIGPLNTSAPVGE